MHFQYFTPTILLVGSGRVSETGELAGAYGRRAFVVSSASALRSGALARVLEELTKCRIAFHDWLKPPGEPTVSMADESAEIARTQACDLVISVGGGSVIDLAKAAAGLATNGGNAKEYLEGVGFGRTFNRPALPHIALPTTAGTGTEVTRNAVLCSPEEKFKKSLRSPYLCPQAAILDAELTVGLPSRQTAASGMDAITQLIESYLSNRSNPITDALSLFGLDLALGAIREAFLHGNRLPARENLLLAGTISGICLANSGLGMAHGFASGLGAMYNIPHCLACAILLPHALHYNRTAACAKLAVLGQRFHPSAGGSDNARTDLAIAFIEQLNRDLQIPPDLRSFSISRDDLPLLAEKSMGNSMTGNPVEVSIPQAIDFLESLVS